MKNYRSAFWVVLGVNLALLTALGFLWWRFGRARASSIASLAPSPPPQTSANQASPPPVGVLAAGAAGSPGGASATAQPAETPLAPIQLSPQRLQSIGVKTGPVEMKNVHDELRVAGNVEQDETRLAYVQTRFPGWIQKVFANATYQYVRKGQPLFTIYSPDLVATEQEYLLAKQNRNDLAQSTVPGVATGAVSLLNAAAERLKQWQVPEREISQLESTGKPQQYLEIDSPASGYITERNALPNMYAQPETRLYTIADLSTVWVYAEVSQNDIGRIKVGDGATLVVDAYPGRPFAGRVNFIWPQVDMTTRTIRVRLIFSNRGMKLSPGMFVNVTLEAPMGRRLVIPASGVFQSGTRQMVFVDHGGGNLEPREIELGPRVADEFIVLKGLKAGEQVVTSANFLIDSESQLQAAAGSFAPPPPGAGAAAANNAPASAATIEFTSSPSPPHKGGNTLRVRLAGADGAPIPGAQVTVTFYMPSMPAMGMAAMRTASNLSDHGGGMYEGSVDLGSGGTWQVTILAQKNGQSLASKQISVSGEGGM